MSKLLVFACFVIVIVGMMESDAQTQKAKIDQPSAKIDFHRGDPRLIPSANLHRFKSPSPFPNHNRPPDRKGGSWHWHVSHGWVWLPLAVAPRTVILPTEFVLPQMVTAYETSPVLVCPHCGKQIVVAIE